MKTGLQVLICVFLTATATKILRAQEDSTSDVTVEFDASGRTGMEGILPVEIAVSLSAKASDRVTVDYEVTGGTAKCGEDYEPVGGTLVFERGENTKNIHLAIMDDEVKEENETVVIALANPKGAKLGTRHKYTYTIVDGGKLDLKVDFGLPIWSGGDSEKGSDEPVTGTIKEGWTPWVSPRWADMYDHGAVQLENVADTGVSMLLSTVRGGHMTLKVCGLISGLAGALPPKGRSLHGPICNSWLYNCDWPDNPWGDIVLAVYNLPAGEYVVKSYHNHFNCVRMRGTDDPTLIDCSAAENPQPAMPSIQALSLNKLLERYEGTATWHNARREFVNARPEYWDYHGQADFPPKGRLGPHGSGAVETIQAAHNIQPQQVTRDEDLVPSVMRFRTDGSAVHIVYQAGCCTHDGVRPSRDGGRAILNAFEIELVRKTETSQGRTATPVEIHPEYLRAVIDYADTLLEHGRDSYGDAKSPVFVAGGLDLKTLEFVRRELKGQGIREGDRAYGANPQQDLNFHQVLYALTQLTGEQKYAREADKALKWFFENCRSPATDLFAWGEHLYWDVEAERCKGRDLHEFYRPWVLWDRSFTLAPEACEKFAEGLWGHQVYNHIGDFSRHAKWSVHGPGRWANFSRHAGFYIATWGHAYKETKNPVFLKAIERVLIFKEASRHPVTNFLPMDRVPNSVNKLLSDITGEEVELSHDPRIGGLHSHVAGTLSLAIDLHDAAKYVDGELKQMMTDFAHTEDEHFLKFHEGLVEDSEHLFVDFGGVSTMKPFAKGRSFCPIWDFEYGKATEAQVAMICYERVRQLPPGKVRDGYLRLITACANRYVKHDPPAEAIRKPGIIGDVVMLMTAAYELSGDRTYLERADYIARLGMDNFLDISPLPRVAVGFEHYEAITRSDTMMMGLLKLWQTENKPETKLQLVYTDR